MRMASLPRNPRHSLGSNVFGKAGEENSIDVGVVVRVDCSHRGKTFKAQHYYLEKPLNVFFKRVPLIRKAYHMSSFARHLVNSLCKEWRIEINHIIFFVQRSKDFENIAV